MNERLKLLRRELNITQQEFADRIGIKRSTMATYESGRNEPIDAVISLICREFDVNEDWLKTGDGEMFEELTDQEKTMKYIAKLVKDKDSVVANAITAVAITYEQLDDAGKAVIDKTLLQCIDNYRSLAKRASNLLAPLWLLLKVCTDEYK